MTDVLIRVADAAEAATALGAGAERVELRLASLGKPERAVAGAVRATGAAPMRLGLDGNGTAADLVRLAADLGFDEVLVEAGWLADLDAAPAGGKPALIVRLDAEAVAAVASLRGRVDGVAVESAAGTRLFDRAGIAQLAALAAACREAALPFGFAGGLEEPDIPRLLMLGPDVLGFDAAVRRDHDPAGALLPGAIEAIRDLVPRASGAGDALAGEGVRDTIFVRDFVVALSIGAYQAEAKARQRVRFSVEATIVRRAGVPRDMRDVFSYDVILETIRVLAERSHVAFVETLAEELAATLLTHAGLVAVTVQVEKLDVIDGAVGVRIARARPTGAT